MKPSTQTILAALARGEKLTPQISLRRYSIMALSQRVTELRQMGFPITSERVTGQKFNQYYWS